MLRLAEPYSQRQIESKFMKTIIIEDEKLAAERLEELIHEIDPSIEISTKLTSVEQSIKYLKQNKPDLIFLDIQLLHASQTRIQHPITNQYSMQSA